jgi:hypothetical protein
MVVAIVALVFAAGGFAIAAIPSADGTIHGCYKKDGGALRVVKGGGGCKAGERALSWNRGVAGVAVRRALMTIALSCKPFPASSMYACSGSKTQVVHCKAYERATGGGYATNTQNSSVQASKPFPDAGKPTGWTISASGGSVSSTPTAPAVQVPIYAVCAT